MVGFFWTFFSSQCTLRTAVYYICFILSAAWPKIALIDLLTITSFHGFAIIIFFLSKLVVLYEFLDFGKKIAYQHESNNLMSIQEYYSSECSLYTLCWKHRSYVIPCMLALIYQSIDLLFTAVLNFVLKLMQKNVPEDSQNLIVLDTIFI